MSMTSVSERASTGSYVTVNSVASSSSGSGASDGTAQPPQSDASDGKKQPISEADRRRRRGPNYKPLDELRLFGKVMSTAIQSVIPDGIKAKLPHYFRKGNAFAVANGAHRSLSVDCVCLPLTHFNNSPGQRWNAKSSTSYAPSCLKHSSPLQFKQPPATSSSKCCLKYGGRRHLECRARLSSVMKVSAAIWQLQC